MNDNAKAGYDTALALTDKNARTIWSIFVALLAVNAFLVSLAAFLGNGAQEPTVLTRLIGGLGLFVCIAWALIMKRSFDFYIFYFAWARKFEADAFEETVEMVRRGEDFSNGDTVTIGDKKYQLSCASRLRVQWLIYAIIFLFVAIYSYILVFGGDWRHVR